MDTFRTHYMKEDLQDEVYEMIPDNRDYIEIRSHFNFPAFLEVFHEDGSREDN